MDGGEQRGAVGDGQAAHDVVGAVADGFDQAQQGVGGGVEGAVGEVLAAVGAGAGVHELVGGAFPGGAAVGFAGECGAQGVEGLAGVADGAAPVAAASAT